MAETFPNLRAMVRHRKFYSLESAEAELVEILAFYDAHHGPNLVTPKNNSGVDSGEA